MKFASLAFVSICILSLSASAQAGNWKKDHPRRAEVNERDKKLEEKTAAAESSGKITQAQAQDLQKKEAAIHDQEKADAAAHNGHITKAEKRELNKEENGVNRKLHREERRNAKKAAAATTAPAAPAAPATN